MPENKHRKCTFAMFFLQSLNGATQIRLIFFFILWCLLSNSVFAADKMLDVSQLNQPTVSLSEYFSILEDSDKTLTLANIQTSEISERFQLNETLGNYLNFHYTSSAYWLRLHLKNSSDKPSVWMLEIPYPPLANIAFYQPSGQGYQTIHSGYSVPFAQRPYRNRFFVLPISIPAYANQLVYLRIETPNAMIIPAKLWQQNAFYEHERTDYIIQALYFGMVIAMVLYNLLIFTILRDVNYLLYVIFSCLSALSMIFYSGLSSELLPWSDSTLGTKIGASTTAAWLFVIFLLFMRRMLSTSIIVPKLDYLLKLFIGINIALPFFLVLLFEQVIKYRSIIVLISSLLILVVSLICALKRQRSAYFFMAAFSFLFLAITLSALSTLSTLQLDISDTEIAIQFGSALEMLLLAFALADRYKTIRQEKEHAQQLLVETLKSSEQLLEMRVAERTAELQIANCKLEALSMTDGLTGIANRRCFDEVLKSEWFRAERQNQPLALGMLDVDWFKKYNDYYGHQMGDECLQNVAKVLTTHVCRASDLVARYGGEEFVFIIPAADDARVLHVAQKICETFKKLALAHEASMFGYVTVSIGVATIIPDKGLSPETLIKNADMALYRAKEQGRNTVICAGIDIGKRHD